MAAADKYMGTCSHLAFGAVGAEGLHVRKAISALGIVFSNGRRSCEGASDPGEFLGVVIRHVEEMVLSVPVLNHWPERLHFSTHIEP